MYGVCTKCDSSNARVESSNSEYLNHDKIICLNCGTQGRVIYWVKDTPRIISVKNRDIEALRELDNYEVDLNSN